MLQRRAPLKRRSEVRERTKDVPRRDFPRHEQFVRGFVCTLYDKPGHVCRGKIQCMHCRLETGGGTALKPPSYFTNPGCEAAHEEQHRIGERTFEVKYGIKLKANALKLAAISPDMAMRAAMEEHRNREPWLFEI